MNVAVFKKNFTRQAADQTWLIGHNLLTFAPVASRISKCIQRESSWELGQFTTISRTVISLLGYSSGNHTLKIFIASEL